MIDSREIKWHRHPDIIYVALPGPHKHTHNQDGDDEISIQGLKGEAAEPQNAGKIRGVTINDTGKTTGSILVYDASGEDPFWKCLGNDTFMGAMNAAGSSNINMWKINSSNQIEPGANINIGAYHLGGGGGYLVFDESGNLALHNGSLNLATTGMVLKIEGIQVVGAQQAAIADHDDTTGTDSDGIARAKINAILAALQAHGLIASA